VTANDKKCESCDAPQVVSASFNVSRMGRTLKALGLYERFCTTCLHAELDSMGLVKKSIFIEPDNSNTKPIIT
jgi:hypothetical protein